jgi:GMP synthase (glutamine-hydrolysing)
MDPSVSAGLLFATVHPVADTSPPQITVLQQASVDPIDRLAGRLGDVRLVRLHDGEAVPALEECGDGLVVLGGPTSAYDDDLAPWLPEVRALLLDAARAGLPTLAICMGAQLLAVAGGGRVEVAAPPGREAGVVRVHWREAALADPVLGPVARAASDGGAHPGGTDVVSMHADAVVELPPQAQWLGWSEMYPYQAFRLGSALAVQFHPEASSSLAVRWALGHTDVTTAEVAEATAARADELDDTCDLLAKAFRAQAARVREEALAVSR